MRVLVTGANGLLGSHIVRELLQRNYEVRAMVREGSNLRALKGLNCELFFGHITDETDVNKAVQDCRFVIHAAARTSQSPSNLEAYYDVNIKSTKYFLEACLKNNIQRFVFVSTANCFGAGTKFSPGIEQNPFPEWLKKSGYAYSKWLAQQYVLENSKKSNLEAVVVNPTFLIGENDVKPSSGAIFFHIVNKLMVLTPPGGKNFVDAATAAQGIIKAMTKGRTGECYLLTGENLSYEDFFKKVINITNQKTVIIKIPSWLLKSLGYFGDLLEKLFKIPVQLTSTNVRMLSIDNFYSAEKAVQDINFKMIPIQQSIEKAILWFQENKYFIKK